MVSCDKSAISGTSGGGFKKLVFIFTIGNMIRCDGCAYVFKWIG